MDNSFNNALVELLPKLRSYCMYMCQDQQDADDLVQDVIVKAITRKELFDGRNLTGWLVSIARNEFINSCRKLKPASFSELNMSDRYDSYSVQHHSIDEEFIISKLNKLGYTSRNSLLMRIDGYSYKEITENLNISMPAVRSAIFFGRKNLEKMGCQPV